MNSSEPEQDLVEFEGQIAGLADICMWAYRMCRPMLVRRIMEGLAELRIQCNPAQKEVVDRQVVRIMEAQNSNSGQLGGTEHETYHRSDCDL